MKPFLIWLFCLMLVGSAVADDDRIDPKEFRVYEAVLSDPTYLQPNTLLMVFADHTEQASNIMVGCKDTAQFVGTCEANGFKVDPDLVKEFLRKNQKTYSLPKEFHFGFDVDIKTISQEQQKAIFKGDPNAIGKHFTAPTRTPTASSPFHAWRTPPPGMLPWCTSPTRAAGCGQAAPFICSNGKASVGKKSTSSIPGIHDSRLPGHARQSLLVRACGFPLSFCHPERERVREREPKDLGARYTSSLGTVPDI